MMRFNSPLPIPANAVVLTEAEKILIGKYMDRVEAYKRQMQAAHESLNDVCMAIAGRAGRTENSFSLSADLGCLIPEEK